MDIYAAADCSVLLDGMPGRTCRGCVKLRHCCISDLRRAEVRDQKELEDINPRMMSSEQKLETIELLKGSLKVRWLQILAEGITHF